MNKCQKKSLILSAVTLSILVGLTLCVMLNLAWFILIDSGIYTKISLPNNQFLTLIVGNFAKIATIVPTLFLSFGFSIYLWRKSKPTLAIWNVSNILAVSFFGYVLKNLVGRTRPDVTQLVSRSSYSFPSGHSILSLALFLSVVLSLSVLFDNRKVRRVVFLLSSYPVLIAASRLYLRVHYPSDILAGFLLSATFILFSYALCLPYFSNKRQPIKREQLLTKKQKGILIGLSILLLIIISGVAYGMKFYYDAKSTVNSMKQPLQREEVIREKQEPVSSMVLGIANDSKRKSDY